MNDIYATRPSVYQPAPSPAAPFLQALIALFSGFAIFILLLVGLMFGYNFAYDGRIFPGISVEGVDLSGMKVSEAASLLSQKLDYPTRGKIGFKYGDKLWVAKPSEVGVFIDTESSALQAYRTGRSGDVFTMLYNQFQAWYTGEDISPLLVFDQRVALLYLNNIAAQIDRPIVEATLGVNGIEVVMRSGQIGRTTDIQGALADLEAQARSYSDGLITLKVKETPPVIFDASQQAELAKKILSAPLVLSVPDAAKNDPGPWTFDQKSLAQMLAIERVQGANGASYQVGLKTETLRSFLEGIAPKLKRDPQNARFTFNDETKQLEVLDHATIGRNLDVDATLNDINQKIVTGEHNIPLRIATTQPQLADDANAAKLGIKEEVSEVISYFYGSAATRIKNIQTAASRFHGVMVPPGAVFSMADVLGDVSLDTGYEEALIILGDRTIKGVGGGVCQVSTTLFRTAFFGGYKIDERHPHAYRVGYYEQTASGGYDSDLAGLDATVFVPEVDFKFTNDRTSWLLMETYVDPGAHTLTWKFYSTNDGRKVDWNTTGPQNLVDPPPPSYELNSDLAKGEIKQVDYEAQGADITVTRSVTKDGQDLYDDTISTHYLPWKAVFQYGPGTKNIPTPEPTEKP